jgi:hypothetical protein
MYVGENRRQRFDGLKNSGLFVIVALLLVLAGLVFLTISRTSIHHDVELVNTVISLNASMPYSPPRAFSAQYFLQGTGNGKVNGSMLDYQQCCVDFYIFTDTGFYNWVANNKTATNSTNSPVYSLNSSAIDAKNGVSPTFTFIPNPSSTYELVFYNANRSLWSTNSTVVYHVIADITLVYSVDPAGLLLYPATALIIAGVVLIIVRWRFIK